MYTRVKNLCRMAVYSREGRIGRVSQVLFDDESWAIRHIVVTLDDALGWRQILVDPSCVADIDQRSGQVRLYIPTSQAVCCPDADSDMPVSRQKARDTSLSTSYCLYANEIPAFFPTAIPSALFEQETDGEPGAGNQPADVHLRSSREVLRYRLRGRDRRFGHIKDFIFSERDWMIRQIEVSVRDGLFSRRIRLSPVWVVDVNWADREVSVDLPAKAIRDAPGDGLSEKLGRSA
jgi:hypothetical protein